MIRIPDTVESEYKGEAQNLAEAVNKAVHETQLTQDEGQRILTQIGQMSTHVFESERNEKFIFWMNGKEVTIHFSESVEIETGDQTIHGSPYDPDFDAGPDAYTTPSTLGVDSKEQKDCQTQVAPWLPGKTDPSIAKAEFADELRRIDEIQGYPNWVKYIAELHRLVSYRIDNERGEPGQTVQDPATTCEWGSGTAADQAVLLASLFEAVGIPYHFVIVDTGGIRHVFTCVDYPFSRTERAAKSLQKYYIKNCSIAFKMDDPEEIHNEGGFFRGLYNLREAPYLHNYPDRYWIPVDTVFGEYVGHVRNMNSYVEGHMENLEKRRKGSICSTLGDELDVSERENELSKAESWDDVGGYKSWIRSIEITSYFLDHMDPGNLSFAKATQYHSLHTASTEIGLPSEIEKQPPEFEFEDTEEKQQERRERINRRREQQEQTTEPDGRNGRSAESTATSLDDLYEDIEDI
jgi:hypothetical protein